MLSLRKDLDPAFHIARKGARALRDQGVTIIGSGMSYHDGDISATGTQKPRAIRRMAGRDGEGAPH